VGHVDLLFSKATPLFLRGCISYFYNYLNINPLFLRGICCVIHNIATHKPTFMKKIDAIIRKSKFDDVRDALHEVNVYFFSYWDVTGVGHEKKEHLYRGVAYSSSDIQRRYLSIVVNDDFVDKTVNAILQAAKTGEVGDGKIFVTPVEEAYRIRTGERGGMTLK
jgi:nitrogen regulatory protein P-II 1